MHLFKSTFSKLLLLIGTLLILSTIGFYYLELRGKENADLLSALWWSVVTLTTVGYGDLVPSSIAGRLLGLLVMICGIGLVSTLTGNLASLLVEQKAKRRKGLLEVNLSGHIIILGWNAYGPQLVKTLQKNGMLDTAGLVLVNSLNQQARDEITFQLDIGDKLHFVWGDISNESVVRKAKPGSAKVVYILCQDDISLKDADQQSIYAALTVRSLAPKVMLLGEVALTENREHLQRAGVNETLVRGELSSSILGMIGHNPSMWTFFRTLMGLAGQEVLGFRKLRADEREMNWREFFLNQRGKDNTLPLALCHLSKNLSLEDIMDEGSALDQFILELFSSTGQQTQIGQQSQQVLINPADHEQLSGYDAVLFLKPGVSQA